MIIYTLPSARAARGVTPPLGAGMSILGGRAASID
jgi:hypothetical protein